jgi:hypothetical protein
VQNVSRNQSFGFGVRVLVKGTWGFASSCNVTLEEVRATTHRAVKLAQANSVYQRKPVTLVPTPKVVTSWKSAFEKDPFDVPIEEKIQFLLKLNETAMKTQGVSFVNAKKDVSFVISCVCGNPEATQNVAGPQVLVQWKRCSPFPGFARQSPEPHCDESLFKGNKPLASLNRASVAFWAEGGLHRQQMNPRLPVCHA